MEHDNSLNPEDVNFRGRDFIPILGALEYSDRIYEFTHGNNGGCLPGYEMKTETRACAMIAYNTLVIGTPLVGIFLGLEKLFN